MKKVFKTILDGKRFKLENVDGSFVSITDKKGEHSLNWSPDGAVHVTAKYKWAVFNDVLFISSLEKGEHPTWVFHSEQITLIGDLVKVS